MYNVEVNGISHTVVDAISRLTLNDNYDEANVRDVGTNYLS